MTDAELTRQAAESVMGWTVYTTPGGNVNARTPGEEHSVYTLEHNYGCGNTRWNPLISVSDAFLLVDALKTRQRASMVLGSNGCADQWTCWIVEGIWSLGRQQNEVPDVGDSYILGCATQPDPCRAITLACIAAAKAGK